MDAGQVPGPSRLWRRAVARAGALVCALVACAGPAVASDVLAPETPRTGLVVETTLDKSVALRASGPVGRVVISQPELAEVALAGPDQIYVTGKEIGSANLLVYDRDGRLSQTVDLRIGYDVVGLRETLAAALPGRKLNVTGLSAGVLVEGAVASPAEAKAVTALAERVAPDSVVSRVEVEDAVVRVDVRIAEVNTRGLRELRTAFVLDDGHLGVGVRDAPIGVSPPQTTATVDTHVGDYRLTAALRALEEKGEARVVAQPMLLIASGARGEFRAGGELPYPLPQDSDTVVVEFKPYGAGLKVIPTVQDNGLVRLQLEAELSEIDPASAITLGGVQVPGLLVRRVGTTAELRDGETLMLAGLLQQTSQRQAIGAPWISKIPIIGPALGGNQGREAQRELAIFVTPYVAQQVPPTLEAVRDAVAPSTSAAEPSAPTRPAAKGPRGPPLLKVVVREVKQALAPPTRWVLGMARRAWSALA
jgi:pilus assembly protein CpaC